ncbi:hypothetical protein EJ103_11635 [Pseudoalteromonas sp. Xi13]|nr:hypothetical protein EJ103_11635 [Pseudoalteromonas sp. Xi13]
MIVEQLEVLPIKKYCELTGETRKAVDSRIQRGIWQEGIHFYCVKNTRERWLNIKNIISWVKTN